jgi:hypothetical protein
MPSDLNKMLESILKDSSDAEETLRILLGKYDELYRESNRQFNQERYEAGPTADLNDFYRLVQTLRRNRDVVGSLVRGINNLRSLSGFQFIEEDVPEKTTPRRPPTQPGNSTGVPIQPDTSGPVQAEQLQTVLQDIVEPVPVEGETNA